MSAYRPTQALSTEVSYRNVDGEWLTLEERSSTGNVISFVLRRERRFNLVLVLCLINLCLISFCTVILVWVVSEILIVLFLFAVILILRHFLVLSVFHDTLLAVESVGVHIECNRGLGILSTTEFLLWDTVEDVFINEVIKGQRVLYYLTLIVKETVNGEDSTRLVPLFQDLLPERKCLEYIYHRTMRNTEQFPYGRELLKVIRRIIKCHPSQGQQFGTKHLLVTYSYTSWTRQDKMFAILKFQQRKNAAAFSHAFVLTIQIPSSENSLGNVRCPVVREVDSHVPVDTDETAKSVICSTNETPAKETETRRDETTDRISQRNIIEGTSDEVLEAIKTPEPQGNARDSANVRKNPDESAKGTATCLANESTEFPDTTVRNESASCDVKRHKRTVKRPIEDVQEQCSKRRRTEEKSGATSQEAKPVQNARKEKSCFPDVAKDQVNNGCSSGLKLAEDFTKGDSTRAIDAKDGRDNDKDDLPRQYYFEKEVDARQKRRPSTSLATDQSMREDPPIFGGKSTETSAKVLDATKSDESDKRDALAGANNKSHRARKQRPRESEKRAAPENKVLRSSNITDLVMEGLMFTIRQDQDSVAVIEQKTKLEVDEVLENSEKAETKAGEKCLLNSSLLRLENMVTMFDSPHGKNERRKTAIGNNAYTVPFANSSIYPSTTVYNLDAYYVDRETNKSSVRACGEHNAARGSSSCRLGWEQQRAAFFCTENSDVYSASGGATGRGDSTEWRSSEQSVISKTSSEVREKELRRAEKEDVISRSFQSTAFSKENEKTIAEPRERSSLVDADVEVTHKCGRSVEGNSPLFDPPSNSHGTPVEERTPAVSSETAESRRRASTPRVISDKIIAIDLMPAALRDAVRSVCRSRGFPAASGTLQRKRETDSGDAAKNRYAKSCAANNLSSTELDSGEMRRDGSSATTINHEDGSKCGSTSARGARETSDRPHCGSRRASLRHGSPRKLQDITEEFYHDLRAQNRDSATQQRRLRQRRRDVVNNGGDVKNGRVRIEMLKFIQDITEGARVVVRRLNVE